MSDYLKKQSLSSVYVNWDDIDLIVEINRILALSLARRTPVVNLVFKELQSEWKKRHSSKRVPKIILDDEFIFHGENNEKNK